MCTQYSLPPRYKEEGGSVVDNANHLYDKGNYVQRGILSNGSTEKG
jgi:hypothetical protein